MKLTLAIQKSGRLHDDSMRLLKECGIDITNGVNKLKAEAGNFPLELYFLRDDDIPQYVEDNVADIGFVGENVVLEKSYREYMGGFTDGVTGEARRGFGAVVTELEQRFPNPDEIVLEKDKKDFAKLFGEYLRVENVLQNLR